MAATPPSLARVRWRDSLIVRILVLCAILVGCLFAAVYFLTGHYYKQVLTTMQHTAENVAENIKVRLDTVPPDQLDLEHVREQVPSNVEGVVIDLDPRERANEPDRLTPRIGPKGEVSFDATQTIKLNRGQIVRLGFSLTVDPQTEVLRALQNRYLLGVICVFLMALGTLIYVIARSLQPLQSLSESCARISEGNLEAIAVGRAPGEIRVLGETFNRMVAALRDKATVEANLRRAQRLSAIGNLAAGVAHDVRNPLNSIKLLSSQAIDDDEAHCRDDDSTTALRTIRSEVDRMEDIVSGFLSLAKEEELRKELQALDPVLEECLNLIQKDAELRGVRISSELRARDAVLLLDAKKLKRAVLNVLINALEVCPPGGRVRLFSRATSDACEIEIRDDGPGMTPEALEHAFDPYFTTKTTGTGLGLSITRGIVEEHGGTIALTSIIGQGTQALIVLPSRPAAIAAEEPVIARKAR